MSRIRLSALWERLRGSLWLVPGLAVVAAIVTGTALALWRPVPGTWLEAFVFGGTAAGARSILTAVASAMITVTGLVFSLTVVALQMASSQYSPRVMRGFLADRGNQAVLAIFLGTFAYAVSVLRIIRDEGPETVTVVPQLAVSLGLILTFLSVGALVYFIHHLTQQLRLETIITSIVDETLATIRGSDGPDDAPWAEIPAPPDSARHVAARRTGYLQTVRPADLTAAAGDAGITVRLRPTIGDHVVEGTTLAWVWPATDGAGIPDDDELAHLVHASLHLGPERTGRDDIAFGLRQLVDIAVRALSPGVNDPTTAVVVVESATPLLCALTERRCGTQVRTDDDGEVRAVVPWPSFADYLSLATDQVSRYGADEPAVLAALARTLTDVAEFARTDEQRRAITRELDRLEATMESSLDGSERGSVTADVATARGALAGRRPPEREVRAD